jgi:trigger factor
MDGLDKTHEFTIPHAIVHREVQVLKEQMLQQFQMPQGAKTPELPDELFLEQAEKRVKVGLVVNEVIRHNELQVDQARLDERLQEVAAPYGEPEQVIAFYRSNPEQMQSLEMGVLEDQVVDLIISQAQIEEVVASYDDFISGAAIAPPEVVEEPEAAAPEEGAQTEQKTTDADDADTK